MNKQLKHKVLSYLPLILLTLGLAIGYGVGRWTAPGERLPDPGETYAAMAQPPVNDLVLRSTPHTTGYYRGTVPFGEPLQVKCSVESEIIQRNDLSSPIWFELDDGQYATSLYVSLENSWDVQVCEGEVPEAPTELQETALGDVFFTGGSPLELKESPSPEAETEREVPFKTQLTLLCHSFGESDSGINGETELWYQVDGGGWAFDGVLGTGSSDPVVAECDEE